MNMIDTIERNKSLINNDDNIYINLSIVNDTDESQIEAKLSTQAEIPYIEKNAMNYEAAIVAFSLPINLVPVLICPPGTTAGTLDYSITIEYASNIFQEYIVFVPANNLTIQNYLYYSLYNYSHMVSMVNTTLSTLYSAASGILPVGCTAAPYMTYDSITGLFSFVAQTAYSGVNIYFNRALWGLFDGFHGSIYSGLSDGRYAKIAVMNNYQNGYTIPTGAPGAGSAAYIMIQDYTSLQAWNSIKTIILTSDIGIRYERQVNLSLNGKLSTSNIIASFSIDHLPPAERVIVYNPGYMRFHDVTRDSTNTDINFQFWMIDKSLNKYPVYIDVGDMSEIRLIFRKKAQKIISL